MSCIIHKSVNGFIIDSGNDLSLVGTSPVSEPVLTYMYCQLGPYDETSLEIFIELFFVQQNAFESIHSQQPS